MEPNEQAKRFLRQILLVRYKLLLKKVQSVYNISDSTLETLYQKIVNIHWIETDENRIR